jgi:DNA-binding XRE family transcriptional regulator
MKASELIKALSKKLGTKSQAELARALGVTTTTLNNWEKRDEDLSASQVAAALAKSRTAAVRKSQLETIQPIVELFPINRCRSNRDARWNVFDAGSSAVLYVRGLKAALEQSVGIYIFYDSRGQALYVGKAREQTLWKEINLAFNRTREVQKITLVRHPDRNQLFQPGYEKLRQPTETRLELFDLASYFSAYQVADGMIDDLEALLVRSFANNLLNVRMETFTHSRRR